MNQGAERGTKVAEQMMSLFTSSREKGEKSGGGKNVTRIIRMDGNDSCVSNPGHAGIFLLGRAGNLLSMETNTGGNWGQE